MKVKFRIIEVISQEFEMDFKDKETAQEEIRKMYHDGKIIVDNASLIQADLIILDEEQETESTNIYS